MDNLWEPIAGTRFFTRNGTGLYERLTSRLYLRVDDLDEADEMECCRQIANRDSIQRGAYAQYAVEIPAR